MAVSADIPVICGPTAGGKSALAVGLAIELRAIGVGAEVITADAFQVYRGMDIGTAKPTPEEMRGVPHHLIDLVEPTDRFTASDWLARAGAVIGDCRARGVIPIVVGGTHLYVKLLVDGMFEGPGADEALRAELNAMDPAALRAELERVDPEAAHRLHPNDIRRTVRAIEVFRLTGRGISEHQRQWGNEHLQSAYRLIVLEWPIERINPRINARVKDMLVRGLEDEVRGLWQRGVLGPTAREALGYKQLVDHFEGRCSLEDAVERIKIETRRFAKNQRTWLKRLRMKPGSIVLDAGVTPADEWQKVVVEALKTPK
ncbi:MAG TPA: tRNA (adenosine(37)-N6)-dimethylallyltransferase MiaA [Phycisphaerales bacterium]|nr:tRNA (adenosine(37)-N6)-dimethylallyltransferase MiaA [Phycisphaerales bacterium]